MRLEIVRADGLDGGVRADGHEDGRVDGAVRRVHDAARARVLAQRASISKPTAGPARVAQRLSYQGWKAYGAFIVW